MSKWEQNAVFEYSEYICLVKRINGIVAQKTLVTELVRCKECKWSKANGTYQWCGRLDSTAQITADDFCSYGQKGDENVETD